MKISTSIPPLVWRKRYPTNEGDRRREKDRIRERSGGKEK